MMKKTFLSLVAIIVMFIGQENILAHCQIPCGIYNDQIRIMMMEEHITTMDKAMRQVTELQKKPSENMNQIVRWVNNKDDHAQQFTKIITYYYMAQRIKVPSSEDERATQQYNTQIQLLHQMMVAAMKVKQTTDHKYIKELRSLLDQFVDAYFDEEAKKHLLKEHGIGME